MVCVTAVMLFSTFPYPMDEFHIAHTVICGQTFRWRLDNAGWWSCLLPQTDPFTGQVTHQLVRLSQDQEMVSYETGPHPNDLTLLRDYFRLDVDLPALSEQFTEADPHIREALREFAGLRVIRQDPVECLFSFLCTSAAPLHRIRRSIAGLCRVYGAPYPGGEVAGLTHFGFPTVERLAESSIPDLMALGLGYRARYVQAAARQILANGGPVWLFGLRAAPYAEAKAALLTLTGIGEKIADCVCLFSLDKDDAIPVDTHIRQIAQRTYLSQTPAAKTLTKAGYAQIGDHLRAQFGPMAGWAQQYLFFHDLYQKGAWESYTALYQPLGEPIRPLKK
jgi:N-glycosylase/DNA lyase